MIADFKSFIVPNLYIPFPKIPSVRITDLCKAMAPGLPIKIIGLRPGEKIHEVLCPLDSSRHTLSFKDHYVIKPDIIFFDRNKKFNRNRLNEVGKFVDKDFDYNSGNNPDFLTVKEIKKTL